MILFNQVAIRQPGFLFPSPYKISDQQNRSLWYTLLQEIITNGQTFHQRDMATLPAQKR